MPPDALAAHAIETGYGRVQVLWGVNLVVRPGETVVLLGANGAGKTTLPAPNYGSVQGTFSGGPTGNGVAHPD